MVKEFIYVPPQVEVLEVEIEKGFAASNGNIGEGSLEGTGEEDF